MKLIISFPHMEEKLHAVKVPLYGSVIHEDEWRENWNTWREAEEKAMAILEETAFALAMERVRRESGKAGYYSDHIGLCYEYDVYKHAYVIDAELLYPELIAVLEDLQKLGSFEMHFEKADGEKVSDDWWHDEDELVLYNPGCSSNYDFESLLKEATA